jgi:mono/diheme cytochrome c family protein
MKGGHSGDAERARVREIEGQRDTLQAAYDAALEARDAIVGQIEEIKARERELISELRPYHKETEAIELRLDSVSVGFLGGRFPRVPTIDQVVLKGFERNNFDQWVDRVERCMNCHVAIDRAGFEEEENPLKTHPDRAYYLGNHPIKGFGCTPCHGGQGASINSVDLAHGNVAYWEDPLKDIHDKVQASCLECHSTAQGMKGTEVVARGEWLFREMGCHGCHLVAGFAHLPKAGPSLKRIGAKTTPEWLVDWIEKPHEFRPRTRMPEFFLNREEAIAVAAYLLASSVDDSRAWLDLHARPAGVDPRSAARVGEGKKLTESLGCLGCHGFEADQYASQVALGKDMAPNLARIAEKTHARWIYHWLKNPRAHSETARMPRLRLSDAEASSITSYLLTLQDQKPLAADSALRAKLADPAVIDDGARLIRRYGCFGCHTINGMEGESRVSVELSDFSHKHLDELYFGDRLDIPNTWDDWTINKILTPRVYATERIEQNMPEFGFEEADARALTVFLASRSTARINHDYLPEMQVREQKLKRGREVVAYYNCYGCHSFDGEEGAIRKYFEDDLEAAPPILVGQGKKVQPEWFFDFLKRPMRLRPWLDVRMPTFGLNDEETTAIVQYFAALDGYNLGPVVLEAREEAHAGLARHGGVPDGYFDCMACHVEGSGRVPDDHYSVSRTPLTPARTAAWMEEHLGIEAVGKGEDEQRAAALREYLDENVN